MSDGNDNKAAGAKPKRRVKASHEWIDDCIAVGQRRGLTPSKVIHGSNGSVEVHFGEQPMTTTKKVKYEWDI